MVAQLRVRAVQDAVQAVIARNDHTQLRDVSHIIEPTDPAL